MKQESLESFVLDLDTIEYCARVAEHLASQRKLSEAKSGFGPETATTAANAFWCEEIASAIRALRAGAKSLKQPIETAPRDGTVVLLLGGSDDNLAFIAEEYRQFATSPCRAMWANGCWIMAFAEAGCVSVEYQDPTHWMPLPALPSVGKLM